MTHDPARAPSFTVAEALQRLMDGNQRFVEGRTRFSTIQPEDLADLTRGQHPFATILCCSDSRVPPELVFDADFGELFIVRVAGNVISPEIAGSLQYAGEHLDTPLFLVLGHEGCGAVQAALADKFHATRVHSRIQALVDRIVPGLAQLDPRLPDPERLSWAIEANVRWTMSQIADSPEGQARQAVGRMRLAGAIYELATGRVRFLSESPPP